MGHDDAADQPCTDAPACGVAEFHAPGIVLEADILRLREMGAQEMRGAGLQRLAVLHHGFDGIGGDGAGEAFVLWLLAGDHRHRQRLL